MNIAFAASEIFPYAKTGGLGDVSGALPIALRKLGHNVKVFMPNYNTINHEKYFINYCHNLGAMQVRLGGVIHEVHAHMTHLPDSDIEIYFIDKPFYYHRNKIYTNDADEDERFSLFQKSVIEILQRLQFRPDIIHCNDWQTGLIPLLIKDNYSWDRMFDRTASVITIHNIGYQGRFAKSALMKAEINENLFYENSPVETWGSANFLKAGLMFADAINTVSETYAKEIMTTEYGAGLEGVLHFRRGDFRGIVNGVDYNVWNPSIDKLIPYHYSADDLSGKHENKKHLLRAMHLPEMENVPLIGIVSRMVSQKGFSLFADAIYNLMSADAQWVILGSGESKFENLFKAVANAFPRTAAVHIGYNDSLSHLIEAGADMFLMPSLYEPCGLNQIYSLKYGTVPIVRNTGGLADTVQDWNYFLHQGLESGTGFSFNDATADALTECVFRAIKTYRFKDAWNKIIRNGMSKDYSWEVSAKKYDDLYKHALYKRNGS